LLHNSLQVTKQNSISFYVDRVRKLINPTSITDEDVYTACETIVFESRNTAYLSLGQCSKLLRQIFCSIRCELEILQDIADDPEVNEIMVNGCEGVFIEKHGKIEKTDLIFDSPDQIKRIIQRLAAKVGREINELNPIVDARLSDGSRINAVYDNIALNGPILTIRKFRKDQITMGELIANGCMSIKQSEYLINAVTTGKNIFISGGTSSGKTTLLNILSDYIPENERIIVIEDSAELQIRGHENCVRLEAKESNIQGKGKVSIRDLIKASLRMRPDRIVVGEVRGDEVVDMIAAMSTGHDGSLSTGHANSPRGLLGRLEALYITSSGFPLESVRFQIAEAIDIIVQLKRYPDGQRKLTDIVEVAGLENNTIVLNQVDLKDDEIES